MASDFRLDDVGNRPVVRIEKGLLAIGHRPRLRQLPILFAEGFTHVVSVLAANESPEPIRSACGNSGLDWHWINLGSTKSLPKQGKPEIATVLDELIGVLGDGGIVFLHCSAGIHRTGMIAAALLFRAGANCTFARRALVHLRPVTAAEMGEARLRWATNFRIRDAGDNHRL
jgi:hypothetical protein